MNLSRAAKKFRTHMAQEPAAPRPARAGRKPKTPPVPEPVVVTPEPIPEPVILADVPEPTPLPKKAWPVKAKRPRFVREKAERRDRIPTPALPPRSTKLTARMLTRNLALLPKDDAALPR